MCGIVGIAPKPGKPFPEREFKALMAEARIRGQHATGISYITDHTLHTLKESVPENKFNYPDLSGAVAAIGHLRYSTSDLEYNQPNSTEYTALVHNGVVTQEPYEKWEAAFGVKCKTRNDSEILMHMLEDGRLPHPLQLVETSQACIALDIDPAGISLMFWRNEQRPLYWAENEEFFVVASTKDIFKRALGMSKVRECDACMHYTYPTVNADLMMQLIRKPNEDLQHV